MAGRYWPSPSPQCYRDYYTTATDEHCGADVFEAAKVFNKHVSTALAPFRVGVIHKQDVSNRYLVHVGLPAPNTRGQGAWEQRSLGAPASSTEVMQVQQILWSSLRDWFAGYLSPLVVAGCQHGCAPGHRGWGNGYGWGANAARPWCGACDRPRPSCGACAMCTSVRSKNSRTQKSWSPCAGGQGMHM